MESGHLRHPFDSCKAGEVDETRLIAQGQTAGRRAHPRPGMRRIGFVCRGTGDENLLPGWTIKLQLKVRISDTCLCECLFLTCRVGPLLLKEQGHASSRGSTPRSGRACCSTAFCAALRGAASAPAPASTTPALRRCRLLSESANDQTQNNGKFQCRQDDSGAGHAGPPFEIDLPRQYKCIGQTA